MSDIDIHAVQNTDINVAPGVTITDLQKRHVGLVLDLFQAKGTMAKLNDGFSDDAVYEDLFATCNNRREVAGQFLGLPLVTRSSRTVSHVVESVTPATPITHTSATAPITNEGISEVHVKVHHVFAFQPLGTEVNMHSTLVIMSDEKVGKIVRLQDRPMEEIPTNSIINLIRKFNALVAPSIVGIPATEQDDVEKVEKHQR